MPGPRGCSSTAAAAQRRAPVTAARHSGQAGLSRRTTISMQRRQKMCLQRVITGSSVSPRPAQGRTWQQWVQEVR